MILGRALFAAMLALTLGCAPGAYAANFTPEQVQMLNRLTPEQRAAALEAMESKGGAGAQTQAPPEFPEVVQPRDVNEPSPVAAKTPFAAPRQTAATQSGEAISEAEKEAKESFALKRFGYDLFAGSPTTFAPATDIPVPTEYVIGPGDTIEVQLFGQENAQYSLTITRDGTLQFPSLGPIRVIGLTFDELRASLEKRIASQFIGVTANITMGALRSIRVFVLGDVERPGSYTVSSLSTMTNALFVSGGIKPIGSLRNIELKRKGQLVTRMDLYDLLLRGDTRADARLQPGDVIFVPPIGATIGVAGEVKRPAIYELKGERTLSDVLALAGGLMPTAYPKGAQLGRINEKRERTIVDVDLTNGSALKQRLNDGDVLHVYSVLERMEDIVLVSGHVERPGGHQWRAGMRLTDVLPAVRDLKPGPDLSYALIKREEQPARTIQLVSVNLSAAFQQPGSEADPLLQPRDEIMVFGITGDRSGQIAPLIERLRQQARYGQPPAIVSIRGNVRFPGTYPLEQGMRISGLVRAAADIEPGTDMRYAIVKRRLSPPAETIEVFSVDLQSSLNATGLSVDVELKPTDEVLVFSNAKERAEAIKPILEELQRQATKNDPARVVSIGGRVRFPGEYPLEKHMRIRDLLRAGGDLSEAAYGMKAEITRYEVMNGEQRATQHHIVDLAKAIAGDPAHNLLLQSRDHLTVKETPQWSDHEYVELRGEVRFPGRYPISRGETLSQVLARAGGLTDFAYADGAVFMRQDLREKEQQRFDEMAARLRNEIAAKMARTNNTQASAEHQHSTQLLQQAVAQLENTKAAGRLVIDLPALTRDRASHQDVVLKNGDLLVVPAAMQEVSVIGEVFYQTSHLYQENKSVHDYVNRSGGITRNADESRTYVIRANGAVIPAKQTSWLRKVSTMSVEPGDTIVVPMNIDPIRPLQTWTSISQIFYQLGVAIAAWNTVGIL